MSSSRTLFTLAAVAGLVAVAFAHAPPPGVGAADDEALLTFDRLVDVNSAGPAQPFQAFDTHAANAFDLDGDGRLELISQNDNHRVYVLDAQSGALRAEIYNGLPNWWGARDENGVAIGDVNGNGHIDLVIVNSAGTITVQELTSVDPNGRFVFEELWQVTPDPRWIDEHYQPPPGYNKGKWNGYPSADGAAYLADVEGNGKLWVFMQADGTAGHYAFDHTGKFRWGTTWGDGNGNPMVKDIDADGRMEAVFVTDGGKIIAYDAITGDHQWVWETEVWPGSMPVNPAVIDLDGDGLMEIITGGRGVKVVPGTSPDGSNEKAQADIPNSHATFVALEHDGTPRWEIQPAFANPVMYMTPPTYDVNGDGTLDVIFLDWNTIGHKPGNWNDTGPANLFAVNGRDGSVLWHTEVHSVWSNKGIILVDLDGDDVPEVLAEEQTWRDGLSYYDVRTGAKKGHVAFPEGHWVASRGPLAADFRGDGDVKVVVPLVRGAAYEHCEGARTNVGCREGAFAVFDTPAGATIWDGGNHPFNHELEHETALPGAVPVPGSGAPPAPPEEPDNPTVPNETDENATDNVTDNTSTNTSNGSETRFDGPGGDNDTTPPTDTGGDNDTFLPLPAPSALAVAAAAVGGAAAVAGRRRR